VEPIFDYDEDGEAVDFGIDEEPEDLVLSGSLASTGLLGVSPSEFAETAIRIPEAGRIADFSFKGREYLRKVYDTPANKVLLVFGRQTEKTTTLGNRMLCYSALVSNFRSLYVAPSAEQAKVFSNDRIKDAIDASPLLRAYTSSSINQAVFFKKFINYSQIRLRYAYLTADRVRGIASDQILIDEIQDILIDNIPVIEQCAFHSKYKMFLYSGTPKSVDNTIEFYWSEFSTQNEWVVPCERHGLPSDSSTWHWNVLTEKNIGSTGLICDKCGETISAQHPKAQWAAMNPMREDNRDKVTFEGYRVPQIMVPWVDWKEILIAQEQYSRSQFMNEKLGRSYDSGVRPITRAQLQSVCKPEIVLGDIESFRRLAQGISIYAGIDWGCHDEETRILTERGFVYFRDLLMTDKVAQWNPRTYEMTFVRPLGITNKQYKGELLHFKGMVVDMLLTPDHKMRLRKNTSDQWLTESALDTTMRGSSVDFVGSVIWKGKEKREFVLPGYPVSPGYGGSPSTSFHMDGWLEFLGYYLSEGGVCYAKNRGKKEPGKRRPNCIKMSQRITCHAANARKMKKCMRRAGIPFSEFPNPKTGDLNWTICGKQFWGWVYENVGPTCSTKRIPREFLSLSIRQLRILWEAMMLGDGSVDKRKGNFNGRYISTSRGLCEDFQELCIKLGLRCTISLDRKAEGNRKDLWSASWSRGDDIFLRPTDNVHAVPYNGRVYCCKVPSGFIVTERNGRIAYQGNSGTESSFTHISFGGYFGTGNFSIFWCHRFTGQDLDPEKQLDLITQMLSQVQVKIIGVDYGGGFYQNDKLIKRFGANKVMKYQYNPRQKKKIYWEPNLRRWMCHRSEVMSDIFNALKAKKIDLPRWEDYQDPHGSDILSIFTEYNVRLRMNEYKKPPGKADDAFHSLLLCMLASCIERPRPDIFAPMQDSGLMENY
jgi:hypothetical protein